MRIRNNNKGADPTMVRYAYIGFTVEATDAIATRNPTKDKINAAKNEPPSMPAVGPFSATQQKINKNKGADK